MTATSYVGLEKWEICDICGIKFIPDWPNQIVCPDCEILNEDSE